MRYKHITQKPYCCVAACVQMILEAESLEIIDQEDIAYELGLIVPEEKLHLVKKAYTGEKPKPGWGTRIHEAKFSLTRFFSNHNLPLREEVCRFDSFNLMKLLLIKSLKL